MRISVDGAVRLDELIADGVLVSTPAGSTAYNLSVNGPIVPLGAPLMALTPISAFRPRRWRGALLPDTARVAIEVLRSRQAAGRRDRRPFRNPSRRARRGRDRPRDLARAAARPRPFAGRADFARTVRALTYCPLSRPCGTRRRHRDGLLIFFTGGKYITSLPKLFRDGISWFEDDDANGVL